MTKKAIRIICGYVDTRQSCKPCWEKLKMLSFLSIYRFKTINFVTQNLHLNNSSIQTKNNYYTSGFKNDVQLVHSNSKIVEQIYSTKENCYRAKFSLT